MSWLLSNELMFFQSVFSLSTTWAASVPWMGSVWPKHSWRSQWWSLSPTKDLLQTDCQKQWKNLYPSQFTLESLHIAQSLLKYWYWTQYLIPFLFCFVISRSLFAASHFFLEKCICCILPSNSSSTQKKGQEMIFLTKSVKR